MTYFWLAFIQTGKFTRWSSVILNHAIIQNYFSSYVRAKSAFIRLESLDIRDVDLQFVQQEGTV